MIGRVTGNQQFFGGPKEDKAHTYNDMISHLALTFISSRAI
jgi:hypothetical protein